MLLSMLFTTLGMSYVVSSYCKKANPCLLHVYCIVPIKSRVRWAYPELGSPNQPCYSYVSASASEGLRDTQSAPLVLATNEIRDLLILRLFHGRLVALITLAKAVLLDSVDPYNHISLLHRGAHVAWYWVIRVN